MEKDKQATQVTQENCQIFPLSQPTSRTPYSRYVDQCVQQIVQGRISDGNVWKGTKLLEPKSRGDDQRRKTCSHGNYGARWFNERHHDLSFNLKS